MIKLSSSNFVEWVMSIKLIDFHSQEGGEKKGWIVLYANCLRNAPKRSVPRNYPLQSLTLNAAKPEKRRIIADAFVRWKIGTPLILFDWIKATNNRYRSDFVFIDFAFDSLFLSRFICLPQIEKLVRISIQEGRLATLNTGYVFGSCLLSSHKSLSSLLVLTLRMN